MATARTICADAMREIGALAIEETPTAGEAEFCLNKLIDMMDSWQTERLMIFTVAPHVFPVVANQASYTLGTGGNFNMARPVMIEDAYIRDAQGNDYPLELVTYDQYSQIISKSVASSIPTVLYADNGYPLQILRPWPVAADGSFSFVLWTWEALTQPTTLNSSVSFPPGYSKALKTNLAMDICSSFGKSASKELIKAATDSKAQVKRINYEVNRMGFDSQLVDRRSYGYYAILTGQ